MVCVHCVSESRAEPDPSSAGGSGVFMGPTCKCKQEQTKAMLTKGPHSWISPMFKVIVNIHG